MKKFVTVAVLLAVLTCVCFTFVACKSDEAVIDSYAIEEKTYKVGDTFSESDVVITANLKNETVRTVDKNLVFVGDDAETLHLDDEGAFTSESVGTYTIQVYAVEERKDLLIGEWTVIVK